MKKLIIGICLTLLVSSSYGQYVNYFSNDTLDQKFNRECGCYYNNSLYVIYKSGQIVNQPSPFLVRNAGYIGYIMKFDNDLVLSDSVKITEAVDTYFEPSDMIIHNDTIYLFGLVIQKNVDYIRTFFSSYTLEFEHIQTTLYGDQQTLDVISNAIINTDNNFVISGRIYREGQDGYLNLRVINKSGSIIYENSDTTLVTNGRIIIQLPESQEYHLSDINSVLVLDSNYNVIEDIVPPVFSRFINVGRHAYYKNDEYFIIGVESYHNSSDSFEKRDNPIEISYHLLDKNANSLDSNHISIPDTFDFPYGIDFKSPNYLCYGGVKNADFSNASFTEVLNWLVVKSENYDTKNTNWIATYGGDANYAMKGLLILPYNECIVYYEKYDWLHTSVFEKDVGIIKIDSTGMIVGVVTSNDVSCDITIFPNPGTNRLNISTAKGEYSIFVYDSFGKLVLQDKLIGSKLYLNTTTLESGLYIVKINNTSTNQTYYKKWIKS